MQAVRCQVMAGSLDNLVSSCNCFSVRYRYTRENCSVARTLEILGDWWTLLVVREAFLGARRFADFAANLPIARNILTARLAHLVEHGVLARVDVGVHGSRYEYALTAMGKDLVVVLTALREWGDRWVFGEGKEPIRVLDRRTGKPLPRLRILDEQARPVRGADMMTVPGPGATAKTIKRYQSTGSARRSAVISAPRPPRPRR
jgi:DNA-binding HxlR family transcriptional regulator